MGLRYSMYHQVGPFTRYVSGGISAPDSTIEYPSGDLIQFYHGLEPRLSLRWLLPDNSSIKAGYSYNYQYVHLTALVQFLYLQIFGIRQQILQSPKWISGQRWIF